MKTRALLFSGVLLLSGSLPARARSGGAERFDFLALDANARAVALGGAYTSLASDANALLYNPAGLGRIEGYEMTFMHNSHFRGITQDYIAYASNQGLGLSVNYLSFGRVPRTTVDNPTGTGLSDAALNDLAFSVGYGRTVHEFLSVGAAVKLLREAIDGSVSSGRALDIGALYEVPSVPDLKFGMTLQNIGGTARHQRAKENLPLNIRAGGSFNFILAQRDHTVSIDVMKERSQNMLVAFGAELRPAAQLPLRLGFAMKNNAGPGLTGGIGWVSKFFQFDYAFVPFGKTLGVAHQLSVTAKWGGHARPLFRRQLKASLGDHTAIRTADDRLERAREFIELDLRKEAKAELEAADLLLTETDSRRVRYFQRLGVISYLEEDYEAARSYFAKGLALGLKLTLRGPAVADSYYGMGLVMEKQGNIEYALKFLRNALHAQPTDKTRDNIMRRLKQIQIDREP